VANEGGVWERGNLALFGLTPENINVPIITDFSPSRGWVGTEITITGKNFDPISNDMVSSLGDWYDLRSSDGTTIKFTIPEFEVDDPTKNVYDFDFYLENENGQGGTFGVAHFKLVRP